METSVLNNDTKISIEPGGYTFVDIAMKINDIDGKVLRRAVRRAVRRAPNQNVGNLFKPKKAKDLGVGNGVSPLKSVSFADDNIGETGSKSTDSTIQSEAHGLDGETLVSNDAYDHGVGNCASQSKSICMMNTSAPGVTSSSDSGLQSVSAMGSDHTPLLDSHLNSGFGSARVSNSGIGDGVQRPYECRHGMNTPHSGVVGDVKTASQQSEGVKISDDMRRTVSSKQGVGSGIGVIAPKGDGKQPLSHALFNINATKGGSFASVIQPKALNTPIQIQELRNDECVEGATVAIPLDIVKSYCYLYQ